MNKRILALVLAFVMTFGLCACASNQVKFEYADEWSQKMPILHTEYEAINKTNDNRLEEILAECREIVKSGIDKEKYSFWNWEKLDSVKVYRADRLVSLYNNQEISESSDAIYDYDKHEVLVFPCCDSYEEDYFRTILIHELIHVLTYSEECYTHMMWEGIADYWARAISEKNGLPFELCYIYEVHFVELFVTFMGEQKFMESFYDGSLNEIIDQNTKKGSGEKFEAILFYMAHYPAVYGRMPTIGEAQFMLKAGQDIIFHMCASYIREMEESQKEKIRDKMMQKVMLNKEYFELVLDG